MYCLLCNDLLVLAEPIEEQKKRTNIPQTVEYCEIERTQISSNSILIENIVLQPKDKNTRFSLCFGLKTENGLIIILDAPDKTERQSWLTSFQKAIDYNKKLSQRTGS